MKPLKHMLVLVAAALVAALPGQASLLTMTSGTSSATVDTGTSAGIRDWVVEGGPDQLNQEWFWYRVGNSGGEQPINALPLVSQNQPIPNVVTLQYGTVAPGNVAVFLTMILSDPVAGDNTASLNKVITVLNLTSSPVQFFEYADFDIGGTANDDQVNITPIGNSVVIQQRDGSLRYLVTLPVSSKPLSQFEAALYAALLSSLNDGNPTTLSDINYAGLGDATWALQWTVNPGQSLTISRDEILSTFAPIPEPKVVIMVALGLVALLLWHPRQVNPDVSAQT